MAVDRATRGGGTSTALALGAPSSTDLNAGITTNSGADWFGPLNPMRPVAPPEVAGRSWDFPSGYNLNQKPRAYEPIDFPQLRALADAWGVLRIIIETRKDQMKRQPWAITPTDETVDLKTNPELKAACDKVTAFFKEPYPGTDWDTWVGKVLEDLFVIDAPAIYPRKTRGGDLYGLKPIDGGTIKRVIDAWGDTPDPPAPAYQQVLHGLGAVNYTSEQLIYRPRNPRTWKAYGFGPVEQIIVIVNLALRRETWQLNFFTDGNLPDALIGTPNEWTPDQIRNFQDWFDARLSGNLGARRGATFVPGEVAKGYVQTKETELFGAAEEWLSRVACFAFSVSPQGFTKMMNRATGETAKESAEEEGLEPIKAWLTSLLNFVIRTHMGRDDVEFGFVEETVIDPQVQSEIIIGEVKAGVISIEEGRKLKGYEPSGNKAAARLQVLTTMGYTPIEVDEQIADASAKQDALGPPPGTEPPAGQPGGAAPPKGGPKGSAGLGSGGGSGSGSKAASLPELSKVDPITTRRPLVRRVEKTLARTVRQTLKATGRDVTAQVRAALAAAEKVVKADPPDHGDGKHNDARIVPIIEASVSKAEIDAIVDALDLSSLDTMIDVITEDLFEIASDTALKALAHVGVMKTDDLVDRVNERAMAFARDRAAELVGKRWTKAGELIDNPSPKWAISDTTRDMVRRTIADGIESNIGTPAIADQLAKAYAFSEERSAVIAHTEVARANEQGKLEGWREAETEGLTVFKIWLTAEDDNVDEEDCEPNGAEGAIPLEEDFPSGDDAPPAHPNCRCVLISEVQDTAVEGDQG